MAGQDIWWAYWYFHLPNYALSLLFYTLFGRLVLGLFLPPPARTRKPPNYIYRWFCRLTDWLLPPVRFITPSQLHGHLLLPVAAFWVVAARVAFFAALYSAGLLPKGAGGGT